MYLKYYIPGTLCGTRVWRRAAAGLIGEITAYRLFYMRIHNAHSIERYNNNRKKLCPKRIRKKKKNTSSYSKFVYVCVAPPTPTPKTEYNVVSLFDGFFVRVHCTSTRGTNRRRRVDKCYNYYQLSSSRGWCYFYFFSLFVFFPFSPLLTRVWNSSDSSIGPRRRSGDEPPGAESRRRYNYIIEVKKWT